MTKIKLYLGSIVLFACFLFLPSDANAGQQKLCADTKSCLTLNTSADTIVEGQYVDVSWDVTSDYNAPDTTFGCTASFQTVPAVVYHAAVTSRTCVPTKFGQSCTTRTITPAYYSFTKSGSARLYPTSNTSYWVDCKVSKNGTVGDYYTMRTCLSVTVNPTNNCQATTCSNQKCFNGFQDVWGTLTSSYGSDTCVVSSSTSCTSADCGKTITSKTFSCLKYDTNNCASPVSCTSACPSETIQCPPCPFSSGGGWREVPPN